MILLFLLVAPALVNSQSLVLVGGGLTDENAAVWNKVVELAGGKGVARIGIFTTASSDPVGAADYYVDMFVRVYGAASATHIPVTQFSNNANDPAIVELVNQQTGFFFGGGDQMRIIRALRPNGRDTLVLTAVKNVLAAGGVVGGTSAGTACQTGSVMITGGTSWNALAYGAYIGGPDPDYPNDLSYDGNGGLGFLNNWVIDTHFSERGREGRLIRLVQDTRNRDIGTTRGFGVDEDTALVITNLYSNPVGTVIGTTGGVFLVDVTNIVSLPSQSTFYERVTTHYLTHDDSIDMTSGAITFASWKTSLVGNEHNNFADVSIDILSTLTDRRWAVHAQQFCDNIRDDTVTHVSVERGPQFQVTFNRVTAYCFGGIFPGNGAYFLVSYKDMTVSIKEA